MPSDIQESEQAEEPGYSESTANPFAISGPPNETRLSSREKLDVQVQDAHRRLAVLRKTQDQLEKQRTRLEDVRRRHSEFLTGRDEMIDNLSRGLVLLERSETEIRRDLEQRERTKEEFQKALTRLRSIDEEKWKEDDSKAQLSEAMMIIDHGRMEWNGALIRWPAIFDSDGRELTDSGKTDARNEVPLRYPEPDLSFRTLLKVGFALTLPLSLIGLIGLISLALLLNRL